MRKAVPIAPRRSPLIPFLAAAVLVLAALYAGYAGQTAPDPDRWRAAAGVLAGAAAMIIVLRLVRRR